MVDLRLLAPLVFGLVASLPLANSGSPSDQATVLPAQTATPSPVRFIPQVFVAPRPGPPMIPQDVQGRILDRDGRGVRGVTVRVQADGWSASTSTGDGGIFSFNLTQGVFTISIPGQSSSPMRVVVDGSTQITVLFRATTSLEPSASGTPTPDVASELPPRVVVTVVVVSTPLSRTKGAATSTDSDSDSDGADAGFLRFGLLVAGAGLGGATLVGAAAFLMNRRSGV